MKYISLPTIFILLQGCSLAFADNWMRVDDIKSNSPAGYQLESDCEQNNKYECLNVDLSTLDTVSAVETVEDDPDRPLFDQSGNFAGFAKKHSLVSDSAKVTAKNQAQAVQAKKDKVSKAYSDIQAGNQILALIVAKNRDKTLTKAQVKQLSQTFAQIQLLLQSGSLQTAKESIQQISPDGTLITETDLQEILAEIDSRIGN